MNAEYLIIIWSATSKSTFVIPNMEFTLREEYYIQFLYGDGDSDIPL
jgi:hypothetical protein